MDLLMHYLEQTGAVLWWTLLGVFAFFGGSWLFDKLDPIDFKKEIERGNIAAAIKLSAVLLGLAGIIITAIS